MYRRAVAAALELIHRRCSSNPWWFIATFLKTEDPQDPENPYKPFPSRCQTYLRQLLDHIQTEPLLAVEKSRQVLVTWLCCAYVLWLLLFRQAVRIYVQSTKQETANELVDKIALLYRSMPTWIKDRHPVKILADKIRTLDTRGEVRAIPEGPEHLRGRTPTLWWSDETAAQKDCALSWKAVRAALSAGKGRALFTSSARPGWFHMLVSDKLESGKAPDPLSHHEIAHGLTKRRLARNGFVVLRLHYTADSMKADPGWIEQAKRGMPEADWRQEMEIDYEALSGVPALPQFTERQSEILVSPFTIPDHWPRYGAMDYGAGTRNPTSIHFYAVDPGTETLYAYWEWYHVAPLGEAMDAFKAHPDSPRLLVLLLDQSCFAKTQQVSSASFAGQQTHSVRSIAEVAGEDHGVWAIPAAKADDKTKIAAWETVWPPQEGRQIRFRIFRTCAMLSRELPGIRWAEWTEEQQRTRNVCEALIDRDNHAFDDASYMLLYRYGAEKPQEARVVPPNEELAAMASRTRQIEDEQKWIDRRVEQQEAFGFWMTHDEQ